MPATSLIDPLFQPELWRDQKAPTPLSPPTAWEALDDDERYYFGGATLQAAGVNRVDYIGPGTLPMQLGFAWEILETSATAILFRYVDRNGDVVSQSLGTAIGSGTITIDDFETDPDGDNPFQWWLTDTAGQATNLRPITTAAIAGCDVSYNCECETDPGARTLLSLRTELLRRAGYASQAANPPPGIEELFNSYLASAQSYLYSRYKALQTKRFFSWRLRPGVRYYGLDAHLQCCAAALNRYRIDGAWIQDQNNTWTPLIYGINPSFYTLDQNLGWPSYFEIRQCIEVFPAPDTVNYKLWIKGNFGLLPLTEDTDTTTIDAAPVLDWAIGLAKSAKGDRDAGVPTPGGETGYFGMAIRQIKDLIANAHVNRRYVPGTRSMPMPTRPVMVRFE